MVKSPSNVKNLPKQSEIIAATKSIDSASMTGSAYFTISSVSNVPASKQLFNQNEAKRKRSNNQHDMTVKKLDKHFVNMTQNIMNKKYSGPESPFRMMPRPSLTKSPSAMSANYKAVGRNFKSPPQNKVKTKQSIVPEY